MEGGQEEVYALEWVRGHSGTMFRTTLLNSCYSEPLGLPWNLQKGLSSTVSSSARSSCPPCLLHCLASGPFPTHQQGARDLEPEEGGSAPSANREIGRQQGCVQGQACSWMGGSGC